MLTRRTLLTTTAAGTAALGIQAASLASAHASDTADTGDTSNPNSANKTTATEGTWEDLGVPIHGITVVKGAFGTLPDGRFVAYSAPQGPDCALNVSTTATDGSEPLGTYATENTAGSRSLLATSGGLVYVATYPHAELYVWDPATEELTSLGVPVEGLGDNAYLYSLSEGRDGRVYGGTYGSGDPAAAKAWSYNPSEKKFYDLGAVSENSAVKYTIGTTFDDEHNALFVSTSPVPELHRIDLGTGDVGEVPLDGLTGSQVETIDYGFYDGKGLVFAVNSGFLRVVDTGTLKEVSFTVDGEQPPPDGFKLGVSGVSGVHGGKVYFTTGSDEKRMLAWYDMRTDDIHVTDHDAHDPLIGYGFTVEDGHDVLYAFAGNYEAKAIRFDIADDDFTIFELGIEPTPAQAFNVLAGGDGQVYVAGYINGTSARFDPASGDFHDGPWFGQVEGWTYAEDTIYAGSYPNGALMSWKPGEDDPITAIATLKESHQQIRPIEVRENDGLVHVGTVPDYGLNGGALVTVDPASGEVDVTIDAVPDHSIASIGLLEDRMYLGSSREGGTGSDPATGSARLVEWDLSAKRILSEADVPVDGAMSVSALEPTGSGNLYALVDTTLVEYTPDLKVVRTVDLLDAHVTNANDGTIVVHPDGPIYVGVLGSVVAVDAESFAATVLKQGGTLRLELAPDGRLYTLAPAEGGTVMTQLARYTPPST